MVKIKVLNALKAALGAKFKLVFIIGIPVALLLVVSAGFGGFTLIRNALFTQPGVQSVTVDVLDEFFSDVFNVATLEIESRNSSVLEIIPGGFINPGTITFIVTYDSTVVFGVRDAERIRARRVGDVMFVESDSIAIEVMYTSVRNFQRGQTFRSNPLVRMTQAVVDQIFDVQREYEANAAQRLDNARNRETAKRNFMLSIESVGRGLGLTVVWE